MGMYKIRVLTDIFEYYHQFHARKIMPRNNELKDREYFGNKWFYKRGVMGGLGGRNEQPKALNPLV